MRLVPVGLGIVGLTVAVFALKACTAPKSAGLTTYTLAAASRSDVKKAVSASGTLQAWSTVDVKSKAGGRIDLLAVDVGSRVKRGDIIAKIDPTDSMLTYGQAKAGTDSAIAKQAQSSKTYGLTVMQASIAVQQAQANVASAKAAQAQAAARFESAKTEDTVQPVLTSAAIGQAQATVDSAAQARAKLTATQAQDRASAQAAYDQAVANDRNAQVSLTRQQRLLAKGFVSQSAVDSAVASAQVTRATVASAKSKLDTLGDQQAAERDSAQTAVEQARAAYRTAQANRYLVASKRNSLDESKGALLQAAAAVKAAQTQLADAIAAQQNGPIKQLDITSASATVAGAQAQLTNAKTTLDQTVVTAPSDGVVLVKSVEQGTIITSGLSLNSTGTSIVTLGDVSRMYVDVAVDETDIASIRLGENVDIAFDAYPDCAFKGKVTKINPQGVVESNVTTIHVRVEVDNTARGFSDLKPLMNATCDFIEGEARNVITVPSEAVHKDGGGSTVDVANGGKAASSDPNVVTGVTIEKRTVKLGVVGGELTEIKSGLTDGERVVVSMDEPKVEADPAPKAAFGGGGPGGPPPGRGPK